MSLRKIQEPAIAPITRDEAKAHLRVTDDLEDDLIDSYILAATDAVENELSRSLISQQWRLTLDCFPSNYLFSRKSLERQLRERRNPDSAFRGINEGNEIVLRNPTIISVDLVEYTDQDGVLQTLPSSMYDVDTEMEPGRLVLKEEYTWPETKNVPNAVKIEYTAGYGASATAVPAAIKQAILYTVAHYFDNREQVVMAPGIVVAEVPKTVTWILAPYRVKEF